MSVAIDEGVLVIDASTSVKSVVAGSIIALGGRRSLVAPPLMWSEATSALRNLVVRGELTTDEMRAAPERLLALSITPIRHPDLYRLASSIATRLGWAKTYDAEDVALAQLLDVPLVTVDIRLVRGARQYVAVLVPEQLDDR